MVYSQISDEQFNYQFNIEFDTSNKVTFDALFYST